MSLNSIIFIKKLIVGELKFNELCRSDILLTILSLRRLF